MAYRSLREFLDRLEGAGELIHAPGSTPRCFSSTIVERRRRPGVEIARHGLPLAARVPRSAGGRGRARPREGEGGPRPRDGGPRRPRRKAGRPGAPLRAPRLGLVPDRDEPLRHAEAHELGALLRRLRGPRAGAARAPQDGAAPELLGQAEDAPEAREARGDGAEARLLGPV